MHNKPFTLITGASQGFGKALALECVGRNMNVILVALPGSGLSNLACYILRNFGVKVFFFEHDLSKKEECYKIFDEVTSMGFKINILVNNAGIGGTHFFDEKDTEYYYRQIELNVVAPTLLTHLFLEMLEENTPSFILNVSSLASFFYLPQKQVYGGTKSYLVSFSKSLRRELKHKGVNVSVVCPGCMNTTPMLFIQNHNLKGLSRWSVMNPEEVAKISIHKMLLKKELIIPGFWNRVFMLLDKLIPKKIKNLIIDLQMRKIKTFNSPVTPFINPLKTAV